MKRIKIPTLVELTNRYMLEYNMSMLNARTRAKRRIEYLLSLRNDNSRDKAPKIHLTIGK